MTQFVRATIAASVLTVLMLPSVARAEGAQPGAPLDQGSSSVGFTVSARMLFTLKRDGRFTDFTGSVAYDPAQPGATHVDLTIYTASVDMKDAGQNELLRSKDFFDVDQFPTMRFVSTDVNTGPGGQLSVTGDLTIRGITKRMMIPVKIVPGREGANRFETQFQIDRTEFGLVGRPNWGGVKVSIGRNVEIRLAIATVNPAIRTQ